MDSYTLFKVTLRWRERENYTIYIHLQNIDSYEDWGFSSQPLADLAETLQSSLRARSGVSFVRETPTQICRVPSTESMSMSLVRKTT